ncbi:MAG TPA: hypothetical protein VIX58_04415, partial [Anaerolineae bacterium]
GFAGRVTLAGYLIMNTDVRAGQDWNILLYWRAEQQLNYNYHVSVQVLSPDEQKVGQLDEEPLGDALPMTRWEPGRVYLEPMRVLINPNTAPGEYSVQVIIYNPVNGERLGEPLTLDKIVVK